MKRQKKYLTREAILKDIAAAHRRMAKWSGRALELSVAAEMQKALGNHARSVALYHDSYYLLERCERIRDTRLKKLGATLAAFDTKPMFGDEQVVLQKCD